MEIPAEKQHFTDRLSYAARAAFAAGPPARPAVRGTRLRRSGACAILLLSANRFWHRTDAIPQITERQKGVCHAQRMFAAQDPHGDPVVFTDRRNCTLHSCVFFRERLRYINVNEKVSQTLMNF